MSIRSVFKEDLKREKVRILFGSNTRAGYFVDDLRVVLKHFMADLIGISKVENLIALESIWGKKTEESSYQNRLGNEKSLKY